MFKTGSPVYGKAFIDRTKDIPRLKAFVDNNQHVVIKAPRRFGKTSLVKHLFEATESEKYHYIYIDVRRATSLKALSEQILQKAYAFAGISNFLRQSKESLLDLLKLFQTIKIDDIGEITLKFVEEESDEVTFFLHALDTVEKIAQKKELYIKFVFDEFQDIVTIASKTILELMRSTMQHHQNVTYIFLGSIESMMQEIFENKRSAFFHFARIMNLRGLDTQELFDYTKALLKEKGLTLDETSLDLLITFLRGHPDYSMQTLQTLYFNAIVNEQSAIGYKEMHEALKSTILENKAYLEELIAKTKTKKHHYEVLHAIANNERLSLDSKTRYNVRMALEDMGLISNVSRGVYKINDIFLEVLLKQHNDEALALEHKLELEM
jgi:hypothetical protein